MSPSTRSKPASQRSPETGAGKDAAKDAAPKAGKAGSDDGERAPADRGGDVEIELEVSRQRTITWAIGGTLGGILLVLNLGTVGVWVGYVLIALGLFRAYQLVMTFVHPPGTIVVSDKTVRLPRGLHRPRPIEVAPSAVTAVYFLRRSVPWNRSAPVLVIELGDRAMAFPRDWFASEADQRHVVHALLHQRGRTADAPATEAKPA
jgi:hypothetical protein